MSAIKSIVARLHRDKRGVSMVEYSILIGLITAAAVRLIAAQSPKIIAAWTTLDTAPKWGKSATAGREHGENLFANWCASECRDFESR